MRKLLLTSLTIFYCFVLSAQSVEVQADYNSAGDCVFSAYNNSKVPVFLHLKFGDLQNTSFSEPVPYVKQLTPGFNDLFTLLRYEGEDVPRFNYEIKMFRSNPLAKIDFDFPYLIPLQEGKTAMFFDVESIDGFWGQGKLSSWTAVGFRVEPGEDVIASRNGIVVEIVGAERKGDAASWYNTWTNAVTVLQPDGTLLCYHNLTVDEKSLKPGDKIYAGQILGQVIQGASDLVLLMYYTSLFSDDPKFIIPKFIHDDGKTDILNSSTPYVVTHPYEVRALEMTKKEQRQVLGKNLKSQ
ncbi:M23 family metallopeptidase [Maribellus sediminis]|uniref:M23 family metallopeptidase n=1 Tax=Maribellus sediminis TaxID=2696285 RepID=UPI00142F9D43|nr:M23 family metallopeptidase [Maribellus sediminis]